MFPWPTTPPTPAERGSFAEAEPRPYWLEQLPERDPHPELTGELEVDLCIVGGGFTGLWAAVQAAERDPGRSIAVLEAGRAGGGASGRNGGFLSCTLTHGLANGLARFGDEIDALERLGRQNFDALIADVERLGIDCHLERTGELMVALAPHELGWLQEEHELLGRFGHDAQLLDGEAVRAKVASPTYLGGLWGRTGNALLDPARLGEGLRGAAERLGVRIFEHTSVQALERSGAGVQARAAGGRCRADRVLLATSAYRPLLPAVRRYIAPVYDYVLVTEPLSAAQWRSVGWDEGQGLADCANHFHYYRPTPDGRILWGGYDAVYRFGGPVRPDLDQHDETFARLAQHFFTTFPQLQGARFSHRWGGAIDTCSRFSVFFGTAHRGRVAYALGYTGLGVGASRFGAAVGLDLLDSRASEALALRYVATKPVPFPPEPLRWAVIELTRNRLMAADRDHGRRGLWLRTLDRLGLGFDS